MIDDLRNLIGVYREIKGIIETDIFDLSLAYDQEVEEESSSINVKEAALINKKAKNANLQNLDELLNELEEELKNTEPKIKRRLALTISRNTTIAKLIKEKSNYTCEICGEEGFLMENGGKYTEVHHIEELSKSMKDSPKNLMAVCPTCHKILHYGTDFELIKGRN